ncbi:DUF1295 domain-containing protein [Rothia nasimurium]|uniref:DUF1295 domain-containing protein n=1 Tax=Rothia nasimurium TaxID=85336 RepID=UPI002DD6BA4B|nr:DUF1295 domain-containing protein [Rothia nasimurium]
MTTYPASGSSSPTKTQHKAAQLRPRLLLALGVVAALALALAAGGSYRGQELSGFKIFALAVGATFVVQWLAFIPAYLKQTERFYDLLGGVGFVAGTLFVLAAADEKDARTWVLGAMVVIWSLRLASFLFWRVHKFGGDDRFDDIKPLKLRFFLTWTLQGLWVAATASAAWIAMASTHRESMGLVSWIGVVVWLVGMTFEVVADLQKTAFKSNPANQGKFISSGLWSVSRHPNYFGEITLWLGVFLVAAPVLVGWQWVALLSPAIVILLLTRVSGIPMLEKKAEKKWGHDPSYRAYVENTPVLIPTLGK